MKKPCACGCGLLTNSTYCRGHQWAARAEKIATPPNPSGLCMCGCGRRTPIATYTSHQTGNVKGHPKRFCVGHGGSYCFQVVPDNPSGECKCECGEKTKISTLTRALRGYAAGQPMNFIHNHHGRKQDYIIEDRGFKTPCWIWQKGKDKNGYGMTTVNRRPFRAHRVYYERKHGPMPEGYEIDHRCYVTSCVNPDHLEAVPPIVNQRRKRTTKLSPELVAMIPDLRARGLSYYAIARELGVTTMAVYNAHIGRTWKGVLVV